jgi:hypothetical protein
MEQKNVLLVLCRRLYAELTIEYIENNTQMKAHGVYEYNEVHTMASILKPIVALVEVPERYGDPVQDAFNVYDEIKEECPDCQILLMCSEQDKISVAACVEAKQKGRIDDFVFYNASVQYLTAKLEAMLPLVS